MIKIIISYTDSAYNTIIIVEEWASASKFCHVMPALFENSRAIGKWILGSIFNKNTRQTANPL